MARLSLRARLLLLLLLVPSTVTVPLLVIAQQRMGRQSRAWVESRSLGVARLLSNALGPALDFDDERSVVVALGQLAAVDGARSAELRRADGTVLGTWGEVRPPPPGPADDGRLVRFEAGRVHVAIPVASRVGAPGTLAVGFDLAELEERQAEVRWLALVAAAILLFTAGSVALAGHRLLIRPLARITDVARRISAGEEQARDDLDLARADEVGTLARAFDVMLRRLRHQRDELRQREESVRAQNAELEERVAARTAAVGAANRELERRLTELKAAQEQLVVAERRAGVGQLAAGVAHEINNPLSYVTGNLAYVSEQLGLVQAALRQGGEEGCSEALQALAEAAPAVADARQGAGRVHQIVRGLKAFSRGDDDARSPVEVATALRAAVDMAMHEIRHRARLEQEVGPLPRVEASEVRLTQVFLNLLVNAAQAIRAGDSSANLIRIRAFTDPAGRAVVEVSDTGGGMTAEVKARLFEPFFTTKPAGVGTGLGLAISQGIVQSYGGAIEVESEPGRGSTFRVCLPPSERDPAAAQPAGSPGPSARRLRLLVVDDDPSVSAVVARRLSRHHEVVTVRSGAAALERLRAGEPFDRVLCDLEMPELSGVDFRAALRDIAPGLASTLIFMTGGAFTEGALQVVDRERGRVLEKPLDFDLLRRMLDAP